MSKKKTVLILGANGRFGCAATDAFAMAGWRVLAQTRRRPGQLPAGAQHLAINVSDINSLTAAAAGASVLIYAINPPYTKWAAEVIPLARCGMRIAENLGAIFMLPGNVYNYGAAMPRLLLEDTPQQPTTRKGKIRFELEAELESRSRSMVQSKPGLRSIVIRAGDFFGAGRGSWFDLSIVKSLASGRLVYPGPLDIAHAWAYLPDLARTFVTVADKLDGAAANSEQLPPFSRLHFSGYSLTGTALLTKIGMAARQLNIAPAGGFKHSGMPWKIIRAGGLVVPMWRELAEMQYLWDVPHILDDTKLKKLIGDVLRTDSYAAICESLIALGLAKQESARTARQHQI